mgnify:CR=1 FL=1
MRRDLVHSRGRVNKLSFFIHDFMHACELDPDRVEACSFMVATPEGPPSTLRAPSCAIPGVG